MATNRMVADVAEARYILVSTAMVDSTERSSPGARMITFITSLFPMKSWPIQRCEDS